MQRERLEEIVACRLRNAVGIGCLSVYYAVLYMKFMFHCTCEMGGGFPDYGK